MKHKATDPPVNDCPPWCTLKPGHGWDSETVDGALLRGHGLIVGDLEGHKAGVEIYSTETLPARGMATIHTAPAILLHGSGWSGEAQLGAAEARRLSALLLDAAGKLEEINTRPIR